MSLLDTKTTEDKLQAALKLYIDKHGFGTLLDKVVRPVFLTLSKRLRVVAIEED